MSLNIVIFSLGYGLLFGGYSDLMRASRAGYLPKNMFNILTELAGGILMIVFFIWAFFVFTWWIVLLATFIGNFVAVFIKLKIFNFPQIHVMLGVIACLYSLS